MRHRVTLGLIAAVSLLLAACGAPTAPAPAPAPTARSVAIQPSAAAAFCPTTQPPDPPFVPPAPYPPTPPSVEPGKVWYGTNQLWTWLHADGTWEMARDEHGLFDKSFWWRQGYDWQTETTPALRVSGRRLDAPAPAVTSSDATNGFEESMGAFMLLGLELPAGLLGVHWSLPRPEPALGGLGDALAAIADRQRHHQTAVAVIGVAVAGPGSR